jgi:hypothetical protein
MVVEAERERRPALRVERAEVGAVGLVPPRDWAPRLPAGCRELLPREIDGDGRVREGLDRVTFGVGQVGQFGPCER